MGALSKSTSTAIQLTITVSLVIGSYPMTFGVDLRSGRTVYIIDDNEATKL